MKGLSIRQPWAGLIVLGLKTIECRSWATSHRGRLLIHAGLAVSGTGVPRRTVKRCPDSRVFAARGAVIGEVVLVDCRPATRRDERAALCDIGPGDCAWVLAEPRLFRRPIRLPGRLGVFDVEI